MKRQPLAPSGDAPEDRAAALHEEPEEQPKVVQKEPEEAVAKAPAEVKEPDDPAPVDAADEDDPAPAETTDDEDISPVDPAKTVSPVPSKTTAEKEPIPVEGDEKDGPGENIELKDIEDEMKQSYMDYAMSVIVGRALPDVRDGLKPVHRRILYAMQDLGIASNKPHKKCARIVGEVLGKYHPHGDSAVYDSLVRMAQDFSLRYPLVDGHGNFGSIDGDNAAAMRYTEARLRKLAEESLQDLDKETVDFVANFDDSLKEPSVLPSKVPNLLINGSSGIAVGMATNIPPHNLRETCDATIHLLDNPEATSLDLMQYVKGPDFPTGGTVANMEGLHRAYLTGKGKVLVKSKTHIDRIKERDVIIIDEVPYMVNKALLIEQMADLVKDKKIDGIHDIRDESDREGIRVVIELNRDTNSEVVLNQLAKHTRLNTTFGINMLALVNGEPKLCPLREMLHHFIIHRIEVVRKRTEFELRKAEDKAHILEGLLKAMAKIDRVIELIKKSRDTASAKQGLITLLEISEKQAQAILDMRLSRLTSLEQDKIKEDHASLMREIARLKEILSSEMNIREVIKEEIAYLVETFGDDRRTAISEEPVEDILIEDLIEEENQIVTITRKGYAKRQSLDVYRQQNRGGRGIIGTQTREEDIVDMLFVANTHSYLLCFTETGTVHWLKVYQIPEGSRTAKGKPLVNLVELGKGDSITAVLPVKEFNNDHYLILVTKNGVVKKTLLSAYSRPRRGGIKAIILDEDDRLIRAAITDGDQEVMLASKNGMCVRFHEKDARAMGRTARGVIGMRLRNDEVIGMVIPDGKFSILTVTQNGYGKRTPMDDYRRIKRGGLGVINIKTSERNGKVVSIRSVDDEDEIMMISSSGIMIRVPVRSISKIGRNTLGVRVMRLIPGQQVVAVAKVIHEDEPDESISQ
ncbi:MAG: DNA gyrase subunit A [archaeon]